MELSKLENKNLNNSQQNKNPFFLYLLIPAFLIAFTLPSITHDPPASDIYQYFFGILLCLPCLGWSQKNWHKTAAIIIICCNFIGISMQVQIGYDYRTRKYERMIHDLRNNMEQIIEQTSSSRSDKKQP